MYMKTNTAAWLKEQTQRRWVMVLIGPPGAGKGTQADLLAEDFGMIHLEASKVIEAKFASADPNDAEIQHEKNLNATGFLNTPATVTKWVLERVRQLAKEGSGLVFSGNPRTLEEAENEVPVFEELYGRPNVVALNINVSEEVSIFRNSHRRICAANRHPIPADFAGETCLKDGSALKRRVNEKGESLDDPKVIPTRLREYRERTEPILQFLIKQGYNIIKINGEQSIVAVHDEMVHALHGLHTSMHLEILKQPEV